MKTYLKRAFQLSDSGVKGLAKSIWSFFLYYVSFVPPMICVFLFADRLLNGNTGKPVVYLLFMLAATLVMYLVINYNYKTTYDETYQESANLRIDDSNGNSYIDIVELNPISCSMCYVNNSIYADVVPEIGECQRQLMMGAEFCYDAIANPKNYDMLRISNKSYTYTSDNQYALL